MTARRLHWRRHTPLTQPPLRGFFVWHRARANSAERDAPIGYEQALVDARVQSRALATSNESRTRLAKLVPLLVTMQGRQNAEMAQRLYDFIMGSGLPAAGRRNVGAGRAQSAAQFWPRALQCAASSRIGSTSRRINASPM